jgi:hypothetical protein
MLSLIKYTILYVVYNLKRGRKFHINKINLKESFSLFFNKICKNGKWGVIK